MLCQLLVVFAVFKMTNFRFFQIRNICRRQIRNLFTCTQNYDWVENNVDSFFFFFSLLAFSPIFHFFHRHSRTFGLKVICPSFKLVFQILGRKFYKNTKKSSLYSKSLLIFIHRTPLVKRHPITRVIRDLLWPMSTPMRNTVYFYVSSSFIYTLKIQ